MGTDYGFREQNLNAIICVKVDGQKDSFRKYHLHNTESGIKSFVTYAGTIPGASHINFYKESDGKFYFQHQLIYRKRLAAAS